ncbi:hypothetical protein [Bdellovibrio svalbardensis]|uniref:Uncharacterized protein n=1 Tax=Bdellovibrio svalbardensis TaxID=2972972 RepID=A0ABT6DI58_9BACT|nr:hypothetical protein [Bdellovibrio svalbardensis]MDG0816478.1 hypothetical protein [Bdellovibrio svalbardensis]
MFNKDVFKERIKKVQTDMKSFSRGKLDSTVEGKIIDSLSNIYLTMADKYADAVRSGVNFPALAEVEDHPQEDRAYFALKNLLEKMELDFTQKLVTSFKHDVTNEVEIGKIQIAFLDHVRRSLHGARTH